MSKRIIFTDEKDFSLEIPRNRKNDGVYGISRKSIAASRLYYEKSRFSKKVMVSAGISWNGKTNIHIIEPGPNAKVDSNAYCHLLAERLLPDCRQLYPDNDYTFQQDGATSHTSNLSQNFLMQNTPNFIKKNQWPPESADLNPMDYSVWDLLSEKVYRGRTTPFTMDELKAKIVECWQEITVDQIRAVISSWKKRLRLVIYSNGGPIDHLLT